MTRRGRVGKRDHMGIVEQHDGTIDAMGQPTHTTADDWTTVVSEFACELTVLSASERMRANQVASDTTHMLYGEYENGKNITADMRVTIDDVVYYVTAAYDPDGDRREWHVECKRELT